MNSPATVKAKQAFTLLELLVVIAIIGILSAMLLPVITDRGCTPAKSTICMSNLRQIGLGFWMYHQDNSNQPPWQVSLNASNVATDYFLKLTPYLKSPKAFVCPTDQARQVAATNFFGFNNTNLSYFVAPLTTMTNPYAILAGDRHLALNNQPVKPGVLALTNNAAMSWTKELHWVKNQKETLGVLAFADGHCEAVKANNLPAAFQLQDLAGTRLVIP